MAICTKHGISEIECDCQQWSAEALAIIRASKLLDAMPVPTKRRMVYVPKTGEIIKIPDK